METIETDRWAFRPIGPKDGICVTEAWNSIPKTPVSALAIFGARFCALGPEAAIFGLTAEILEGNSSNFKNIILKSPRQVVALSSGQFVVACEDQVVAFSPEGKKQWEYAVEGVSSLVRHPKEPYFSFCANGTGYLVIEGEINELQADHMIWDPEGSTAAIINKSQVCVANQDTGEYFEVNSPAPVKFASYIGPYLFVVSQEEEEEVQRFLLDKQREWKDCAETCPPFGDESRPFAWYFGDLSGWQAKNKSLAVSAFSKSCDLSIFTPENVFEALDDDAQAYMPMDEEGNDTSPVGAAVDWSNKDPVSRPFAGIESGNAAPIFWVLNNKGKIFGWYVASRDALEEGAIIKPITATSEADFPESKSSKPAETKKEPGEPEQPEPEQPEPEQPEELNPEPAVDQTSQTEPAPKLKETAGPEPETKSQDESESKGGDKAQVDPEPERVKEPDAQPEDSKPLEPPAKVEESESIESNGSSKPVGKASEPKQDDMKPVTTTAHEGEAKAPKAEGTTEINEDIKPKDTEPKIVPANTESNESNTRSKGPIKSDNSKSLESRWGQETKTTSASTIAGTTPFGKPSVFAKASGSTGEKATLSADFGTPQTLKLTSTPKGQSDVKLTPQQETKAEIKAEIKSAASKKEFAQSPYASFSQKDYKMPTTSGNIFASNKSTDKGDDSTTKSKPLSGLLQGVSGNKSKEKLEEFTEESDEDSEEENSDEEPVNQYSSLDISDRLGRSLNNDPSGEEDDSGSEEEDDDSQDGGEDGEGQEGDSESSQSPSNQGSATEAEEWDSQEFESETAIELNPADAQDEAWDTAEHDQAASPEVRELRTGNEAPVKSTRFGGEEALFDTPTGTLNVPKTPSFFNPKGPVELDTPTPAGLDTPVEVEYQPEPEPSKPVFDHINSTTCEETDDLGMEPFEPIEYYELGTLDQVYAETNSFFQVVDNNLRVLSQHVGRQKEEAASEESEDTYVLVSSVHDFGNELTELVAAVKAKAGGDTLSEKLLATVNSVDTLVSSVQQLLQTLVPATSSRYSTQQMPYRSTQLQYQLRTKTSAARAQLKDIEDKLTIVRVQCGQEPKISDLNLVVDILTREIGRVREQYPDIFSNPLNLSPLSEELDRIQAPGFNREAFLDEVESTRKVQSLCRLYQLADVNDVVQ